MRTPTSPHGEAPNRHRFGAKSGERARVERRIGAETHGSVAHGLGKRGWIASGAHGHEG